MVALCALALVSPAGEPLRSFAGPSPAASGSLDQAGSAVEPPRATTPPATPAPLPGSSTEIGSQDTDPAPSPATRPDDLTTDIPPQADASSQSGTLASNAPAPGAAPTPAPSLPPQPASIPPLSATDAELSAAAAGHVETSPEVSTQALVRDSNTSQLVAVFDAINKYRASLNLPLVRYHDTVAAMSQEWAENIASREVIEHRANFWSDARALSPTNGAGEVIAVRWDRDAAQLVEWWKGSPAHNAILRDPRFNVIGIGIAFTDGDWRTSSTRYTMWGVVNFFGFNVLPAGTTSGPGGGTDGVPAPSPSVCDPAVKHMPPTLDLTAADIKSASDLLSVNSAGALVNRPSLGNRNYGPPVVIGGGFSSARQIFLTDWERDGVYDVLAQWTDGSVTLHSGLADGGFRTSVTLGQSGWAGMTVALGQWCSNNRLPQLLALDGSGNLWLYHNTGLGDLSRRTMVSTGIAATRLSMVDYDADGFQDLLALQSNGNVLLYRGAGVPSPRTEPRAVVASGWLDVTAIRPLRNVTGLNSTGLALRRGGDVVQYWDLSNGALSSPTNISGAWAGIRLAQ